MNSPYSHDVADPEHSQYRPDFYYPDIDVWHEHWALDGAGQPPPSFTGYAESMEWKRADTPLLWHDTARDHVGGQSSISKGFAALGEELVARGAELGLGGQTEP